MERREVVNASKAKARPDEWSFETPTVTPIPPVSAAPHSSDFTPIGQPDDLQFPTAQFPEGQRSAMQALRTPSSPRPPCLYLGPGGERCYRPALDNGFCSRHQQNSSPAAPQDDSRARKKKAAAAVGILAVIWPLIEELLRQIFRLLR